MSVAKDPNGNPMPLALTEFGVASGSPSAANYSTDLTTALTMMYGDPQATTFGYWGGLGGPNDSNGIYSLYNSSYQLTSTGTTWQNWMNQWNTNVTLTTDANGNISFNGTYGLYTVTVGGQNYTLNLTKGTTTYGLMTPIGASTWSAPVATATGAPPETGPTHPSPPTHRSSSPEPPTSPPTMTPPSTPNTPESPSTAGARVRRRRQRHQSCWRHRQQQHQPPNHQHRDRVAGQHHG